MTYKNRDQLGLEPRKWATKLNPDQVNRIVVHWLGVPGAVTKPESTWIGVQRNHMGTRGWSDIAYNFGVTLDGTVFEGRGLDNQPGANGRGNNHDALAVCAIVTTEDKLTDEFWDGLEGIIWLIVRKYPNITEIVGHRDVSETACPGDEILAGLDQLTFRPVEPVNTATPIPHDWDPLTSPPMGSITPPAEPEPDGKNEALTEVLKTIVDIRNNLDALEFQLRTKGIIQ